VEKLTGLCLGDIYIPIPIGSLLFIVYLVQYYTIGHAYGTNERYATNQQDASLLSWSSSGLGRRSLSSSCKIPFGGNDERVGDLESH
jgi:hypothetical protein